MICQGLFKFFLLNLNLIYYLLTFFIVLNNAVVSYSNPIRKKNVMLGILLLILLVLFFIACISAAFHLFGWALHSLGIIGTLLVIVFVIWLVNRK